MTAWDTQESTSQYMTAGAHKAAMPHLLYWCDEASVAHWSQEETTLPSWVEADKRMREEGRVSKVLNPSPRQATMSFDTPRMKGGSAIGRPELLPAPRSQWCPKCNNHTYY